MSRRIVPRVDHYSVPVRAASPQSVGLARRLAALLTAPALAGAGSLRYGYPAPGTRVKFAGYADTPQLFTGYDPRKVAGGTFRGAPGGLPATSGPVTPGSTPLMRAMAVVSSAQMGGSDG